MRLGDGRGGAERARARKRNQAAPPNWRAHRTPTRHGRPLSPNQPTPWCSFFLSPPLTLVQLARQDGLVQQGLAGRPPRVRRLKRVAHVHGPPRLRAQQDADAGRGQGALLGRGAVGQEAGVVVGHVDEDELRGGGGGIKNTRHVLRGGLPRSCPSLSLCFFSPGAARTAGRSSRAGRARRVPWLEERQRESERGELASCSALSPRTRSVVRSLFRTKRVRPALPRGHAHKCARACS